MQRGSLKKVLDRHGVSVWRAQWRENGKGRTRILGRYIDVRRGNARAELDKIVAAVNGKPCPPNPSDTVRRFVENEYLTQRTRQWKGSTGITRSNPNFTLVHPRKSAARAASLSARPGRVLITARRTGRATS